MKTRLNLKVLRTIACFVTIFALMCGSAWAQWVKVPAAAIPQSNGKPNLSAPAPKLSNGTPDLSGIWEPPSPPKYLRNLAADMKPEDVPYQPSFVIVVNSSLPCRTPVAMSEG